MLDIHEGSRGRREAWSATGVFLCAADAGEWRALDVHQGS